jgi:rare lipoprotein A
MLFLNWKNSKNIFATVARKVGPPWLFLLVFLVIWFCPFFSLAEADVKEAPKVRSSQTKTQTGKASYYCKKFHGKKTACGQVYNRHELVAAHCSFPFGTLLLVTNLENGRQVKVRVVDRGPSKAHRAKGIIIDLSRGAAEKLHMVKKGRALVKLEVLEWGKSKKILGEADGETDSYS